LEIIAFLFTGIVKHTVRFAFVLFIDGLACTRGIEPMMTAISYRRIISGFE
jgi:hypothetical protein